MIYQELFHELIKVVAIGYRSSVTRMSVEQKHNVMKSVDGQERGTLDVIPPEEEKAKSSSSSCSEEDETSSTESETGMTSFYDIT